MSLSVLELSVEDLSEQLRANAVSAIEPTTLQNAKTQRSSGTSTSIQLSPAVSDRALPSAPTRMPGQHDRASPIVP
jgi:hypothetical protein